MRLSETARVYQLKNGHTMTGKITHGNTVTPFKYGIKNDNRGKSTYIHGIEGGQSATEIETVEPVKAEIGDKVQLVDGRKGRVENISVDILDEAQLRFVSFEKADKIVRITISYL